MAKCPCTTDGECPRPSRRYNARAFRVFICACDHNSTYTCPIFFGNPKLNPPTDTLPPLGPRTLTAGSSCACACVADCTVCACAAEKCPCTGGAKIPPPVFVLSSASFFHFFFFAKKRDENPNLFPPRRQVHLRRRLRRLRRRHNEVVIPGRGAHRASPDTSKRALRCGLSNIKPKNKNAHSESVAVVQSMLRMSDLYKCPCTKAL